MRCPKTKEALHVADGGGNLMSAISGQRWRCDGFVPQLFADAEIKTYPVEHFSHHLAPQAVDMIDAADGLILNLSAGGSHEWFSNVIEVEAGVFRNTDIVADSHNLPFQDEVFAGCIAMNSFEHYHSPAVAAEEILRVLKPGAPVLIHTAFLQPLHEAPYHFFNATPFGVRRWFEGFSDVHLTTPYNFNPVFGLSWMISDLDLGLRAEGKFVEAELLSGLTFADMLTFWRDPSARCGPAWDAFFSASTDLQGRLAAGIELIARKPPKA